MPKYKLTYFNAKALGEPVRYMLSYMGTEFEDVRIPIRTASNIWDMCVVPFGKIPMLEIDGRKLHHAAAIMRYLAADAGLAGDNVDEFLEIDMVTCTFGDFQYEIARYFRTINNEEKETVKEELKKKIIPDYLQQFETYLKENNGYFSNKKLTWADLYIISYCESFPGFLEIDLFEKSEPLKELRDKLHSIPGIKEWVQKRPVTKL